MTTKTPSDFRRVLCPLDSIDPPQTLLDRQTSVFHGELAHDLMEPDEGVQIFTMWDAKPNQ